MFKRTEEQSQQRALLTGQRLR
ncbi:MAG TPA: recombinase RecX, partial [Acinetobacter sp.]|nr:recombinase RecX [Acinetobacter sp.]